MTLSHRSKPSMAILSLILLAVAALACNMPRSTSAPTLPPTVTPFLPSFSTPTTEPALEATPIPTDTPVPTLTPTPTPAPTATPRPISEGPLDFQPPTWVHAWEEQPDGGVRVGLKITITGGAPPFTISHGGAVDGQTWEREYYIDFIRHGCAGIPQNITVQSADGQTVSKDYWIGLEQQPWCSD